MSNRLACIVRYWIPVAVWLALIAIESTDLLSGRHTSSFLYTVLTSLFGPVSRAFVAHLNQLLRKTGHFLGYGTLGLLFFRALRATFFGTVRRWALLAVMLTFVVASLDEFHQSFLPSRGGRIQDVFLDTGGAICVLLLLFALVRIRQKRARFEPHDAPEYAAK